MDGYKSINPLFMKYTPNVRGEFVGQNGYGYKSIENFIITCSSIMKTPELLSNYQNISGVTDSSLATIYNTYYTTCILEAGRISLDNKCIVELEYSSNQTTNTTIGMKVLNDIGPSCHPCGYKLK